MTAYFPAVLALIAVLAASPAQATATTTTSETTAVETTTSTISENYTLEDGTSIVVENGQVFSVNAEGVRSPVADGALATKEGKTLTVKDGALVADVAVPVETEIDVETTAE